MLSVSKEIVTKKDGLMFRKIIILRRITDVQEFETKIRKMMIETKFARIIPKKDPHIRRETMKIDVRLLRLERKNPEVALNRRDRKGKNREGKKDANSLARNLAEKSGNLRSVGNNRVRNNDGNNLGLNKMNNPVGKKRNDELHRRRPILSSIRHKKTQRNYQLCVFFLLF
jgi:hypothetical protein